MSNATASPHLLTWKEITDWSIVYGVEAFITVFVNLITLLVILTNKFLHKRFYFLLLSLAIADMLIGGVACPMFIYVLWAFYSGEYTGTKEYLSDVMTAQTMVEIFTSYASIFALVAIAVERMIAVMFHWFHQNESRISYIVAIIITWLLAVCTSILYLLKFIIKNRDVYFYTLMVLMSASLLIVLVCYIIIAVKLCQTPNDAITNRQQKEHHIAFTLLVASVLFIALWLPFQVANYIFHYDPYYEITHHFIYATKLLHYFNSIINPFIYALMMKEFRTGLKNLFTCTFNNQLTAPAGNVHVKHISGPKMNQGYDDDVTMSYVSKVL